MANSTQSFERTTNLVMVILFLDDLEGLERSLSSIAGQSLVPQILIKSEGTVDVSQYAAEGIRVVTQRDSGIYQALNQALARIQGNPVIGLLHCGDVLKHPKTLEKVMAQFNHEPQAQWLYGGVEILGTNNQVVRKWIPQVFSPNQIRKGYMPPHPGVYFKKEAFTQVGPFNENLKISGDYHWLLRLMESKLMGIHFDEIIVVMAPQGLSANTPLRLNQKRKEDIWALRDVLRISGFKGHFIWLRKIARQLLNLR